MSLRRQKRFERMIALQQEADRINREIRQLAMLLAVPEGDESITSLVDMYFSTRPPGEARKFADARLRIATILREQFEVTTVAHLEQFFVDYGKPLRGDILRWLLVDPVGEAYGLLVDIVAWAQFDSE